MADTEVGMIEFVVLPRDVNILIDTFLKGQLEAERMQQQKNHLIFFCAEVNTQSVTALTTNAFNQLTTTTNNVFIAIDSSGGSVSEAVRAYEILRELSRSLTTAKRKLVTINLSNIESAANIIFLAADERVATPASSFLLHPPKTILPASLFAADLQVNPFWLHGCC